jgi:ABC-type antimicrobial peptide transport system permease subunit
MNYADIFALALRNLNQAKLRTALTVIGVIVGVAAIITMVSFGIGLQRNIIGQAFARLDAFTAITVLGADTEDLLAMSEGRTALDEDEEETAKPANAEAMASPAPKATPAESPNNDGSPNVPRRPRRVLDEATLAEIGKLKGVRFVAPIVTFTCFTRFNERTRMQLIAGATTGDDPRFKTFLAGGGFRSADANEAIINENFLTAFSPEAFRRRRNRRGGPPQGGPFQAAPTKSDEERVRDAQAALGKEITLLSQPGEEGAVASIFGIPLLNPTVQANDLANEGRFEKHTFRIVGVLKTEGGLNFSPFGNANFFLPLEQAKRLRLANLSPMERMGETLTGRGETPNYRALELRVADPGQIKPVTAELEKLGLRAFSVTTQLEEIERIFLIINSSLALIGGIALLVASFGISNTMIMSIRERTREIGIMKAIGGSDGEIMKIFFVEASLIGLLGGMLGLLAGWGVDRVANLLANQWIVRQAGQAMHYVEFFSIPWYLSGGAILFAVLISLIAAIYPALRAAKVDPIKALRYE